MLLTVCHDQRLAKITSGSTLTRKMMFEENDVTTADQMKAALLSHRGVNGVRVAVVEGQTEAFPLEKSKIP